MALAKKCDRCKKLYEPYPTGKKIEHNAIKKGHISAKGEFINCSEWNDLCSDCMNEFDKFMTAFMCNKPEGKKDD